MNPPREGSSCFWFRKIVYQGSRLFWEWAEDRRKRWWLFADIAILILLVRVCLGDTEVALRWFAKIGLMLVILKYVCCEQHLLKRVEVAVVNGLIRIVEKNDWLCAVLAVIMIAFAAFCLLDVFAFLMK